MADAILLSPVEMGRIKPFFPLSHSAARVDGRCAISGIVFGIRNGLRWRDEPSAYGPHKTLSNRFIRWSGLGVLTTSSQGSPVRRASLTG